MSVTLVCEESFDGIMSAVYRAWELMLEGENVKIYPGNDYSYDLFTEYVECPTDLERAIKVAKSIRLKISLEAYMMVFRASMHYEKDRADAVIEFLKIGYRVGSRVTKMLGQPAIMKIVEYSRKVANEAHLFKGFVRFSELEGGILLSKIEPKCDVLPVLQKHFEERYPLENWIIYDEKRKKAMFHKCNSEAIIVAGQDVEQTMDNIKGIDEYSKLWNVFFNAIGIKERCNPKCQQTNLPRWYRKNMSEFSE